MVEELLKMKEEVFVMVAVGLQMVENAGGSGRGVGG
jgi:hypothetical protein